jgi:hypothetical protein
VKSSVSGKKSIRNTAIDGSKQGSSVLMGEKDIDNIIESMKSIIS